jgi:2-polyprenyl-3-methyl-5-hydroxy-6-metoxy-1,4-benzoquinol methylase
MEIYDENVVCPVNGDPLHRDGSEFVSSSGRRYQIEGDLPLLFVDEHIDDGDTSGTSRTVTHNVQDFYEDAPFPNYNSFDNVSVFVERARQGIFARLLSEQIPPNSSVLEIGCGTGQLSNFLAATTMSGVYATDMTRASLRLGQKFARDNRIGGIEFLQMNLFRPCIRPSSMDIVLSNGVLHHTYDTKKAFLSISRLVKPGGYIIVGLYNRLGRLRTDFRRCLVRMFGESVLLLDPHLRKDLSPDKRRAWIKDQYHHPSERKHTMSETLEWFDEAGFDFISSIPKIQGEFSLEEQLFARQRPGSPLDRKMTEIEMLFSHYGGEGGLYIMIGRRLGG